MAGGVVAKVTGMAMASSESVLSFNLTIGGRPVTDLQPYLGAFGHLVAIRSGDLAYLHVHPFNPKPGSSTLTFMADFPTASSYRLFLQVQRNGSVTALPLTMEVMA